MKHIDLMDLEVIEETITNSAIGVWGGGFCGIWCKGGSICGIACEP